MLRDCSFRRRRVVSGAPADLRGSILECRSSVGFRSVRAYAVVSRAAATETISELSSNAPADFASPVQSLDPRPRQHQSQYVPERACGWSGGSKPGNDQTSADRRGVLLHYRHGDRVGLRPRTLPLRSRRRGGCAGSGCCISLQFVSVSRDHSVRGFTGRGRLFHCSLVFAAFVPAITNGFAGFLVGFLQQDGRSTLGARLGDRLVPSREFAIRIARATVEDLPAFGAADYNFPRAAFFRARNPERFALDEFALRVIAARNKLTVPAVLFHQVVAALGAFFVKRNIADSGSRPFLDDNLLRVTALGIAGAGHEVAEPSALKGHGPAALFACLFRDFRSRHRGAAVFCRKFGSEIAGVIAIRIAGAGQEAAGAAQPYHHRLAAFLALDIGRDAFALQVRHFALGGLQVFLELLVELVECPCPRKLAFFDFIQFFFHACRIGDVENVGEAFDEQVIHYHAEFGGQKAALLLFHIISVLNHGKDGGVS